LHVPREPAVRDTSHQQKGAALVSALDDARAAVQKSDELAGRRVRHDEEIRALRDAMRALMQHVEELEERLDTHVKKPHARPRRVYG
jgi:predicted  nucleic acid-binding Zn-ribbon protein